MILDYNNFQWKKWNAPVFTTDDTWGQLRASGESAGYEAYHAMDQQVDSAWKVSGADAQLSWMLLHPLCIYAVRVSGTAGMDICFYADTAEGQKMGNASEETEGSYLFHPGIPIAVDTLVLTCHSPAGEVQINTMEVLAEEGSITDLSPFMNTADGMETVSSGFNDDSTFSVKGISTFLFNGSAADTVYVSSNHWVGFRSGSEDLKILRRDGCSTMIYRQEAQADDGTGFLKIRFEGYTVYGSRVEENRIIFELFLLSNQDMFLNVIQTPASSNTGISELNCNGIAQTLNLVKGDGSGTVVSFYHEDEEGKNWRIAYEEYRGHGGNEISQGFLICSGGKVYSVKDKQLVEVPVNSICAAAFLAYGCQKIPESNLLIGLSSPEIYYWKASGEQAQLMAHMAAYPYPQVLTAVADMSHETILGIKEITADYSGDIRISVSEDGKSYTEEVPLGEWMSVEPDRIYESLASDKKLYLRMYLHGDAALKSFHITYKN